MELPADGPVQPPAVAPGGDGGSGADARSGDVFLRLLSSRFDVATLDRHPATVVGLWPDLRVAWVNAAWNAFAGANGGNPAVAERWGIGARYLDAVAEPLRPFYERLLRSVPEDGVSLHPVSHEYECSSATTFRKFTMQVYALPQRGGVVIVNALAVEAPHDAGVAAPDSVLESKYRTSRGVVVQCAHCRRVQHAQDPTRWDWVGAWVRRMPANTSHGLCETCVGYYYPEDGD